VPRDGTATRERILDAAEHLVIENGYAATSVDHVIAASGSSKGAFFHHFDSKRDLARALVGRYVEADLAHLAGALEATAGITDPAERALAFVRLFEDGADELMREQSGCLYISVLTERDLTFDGTAREIRQAIVDWRVAYAELLRAALGSRAASVDADALADHLFVTFEGAFLLCRSLGDASHMRTQLATYRRLVAAVLGVTTD
jgi:TetR/AcrR family transcriptional regulator, transcriptional repressor for nem operon